MIAKAQAKAVFILTKFKLYAKLNCSDRTLTL